jgi:hypothetical protein
MFISLPPLKTLQFEALSLYHVIVSSSRFAHLSYQVIATLACSDAPFELEAVP